MRIAFDTLFASDEALSSIHSFFAALDLDVDLNQDNSSELRILPMHHLASKFQEEEEVFALIRLKERRNYLLIRCDLVNHDDRIGLMKNATVFVKEGFVQRKLQGLRKDIKFEVKAENAILSDVLLGQAENVLVSGCLLQSEFSANYVHIALEAREFGHHPGQGYLAIVGKKSHPLRKLIRKQNSRDDIVICNIERKAQLLNPSKLNIHCEIDRSANFHLWVFTEEAETHISQSTRNEIEERALKNL